jgi:plastocyanin
MRFTRLACLVVTSVLLGCGGGSDDGTGPPPPPPPPPGNQTLGSIQTNFTTLNLNAGESQTITVTAYDTQNAVIPAAGTPTFSSGSSTIASVETTGLVTGVSAGSTNITASLTRGGVTRTATVAVTVTGSLPTTATVSTQNDQFNPGTVTIGRPGVVTWNFVGITVHNVTFGSAPGAPSNISDTYGQTVNRSFNTAGTFSYNCTIHAGMSGQVVVR